MRISTQLRWGNEFLSLQPKEEKEKRSRLGMGNFTLDKGATGRWGEGRVQ